MDSRERAQRLLDEKHRVGRAAAELRRRIAQDVYAGLSGQDAAYALCAVLDTASIDLDRLPAPHRRAVSEAATEILGDRPRGGPVDPITKGDGH